MARGLTVALAVVLAVVGVAEAVPRAGEPRPHPGGIPAEPSYVKRVEPAIVGLRVRADEAASSSTRLGSRRFGSGVIFDRDGYAVTVSYILLDALTIEAVLCRHASSASTSSPGSAWSGSRGPGPGRPPPWANRATPRAGC